MFLGHQLRDAGPLVLESSHIFQIHNVVMILVYLQSPELLDLSSLEQIRRIVDFGHKFEFLVSELLTTRMHKLILELLAAPFCSFGLILFVQRGTPFRP